MNPLLLGGLFDIGKQLIDRFLPDPEKKAAAQMELLKMKESGDLARMADATENLKAFLADVQNARERDKAFLAAGRRNIRGDVLAYGALAALGACIVLLFFLEPAPQSRDLLLVTLGALVAIVKDVFGFEFGSSKGSERNAQAVADALKNGG